MIRAPTRVACVLGAPVRHSLSPALHNAAFAAAGIDAVFVAFEVAPAQLEAAVAGLRALQLLGASVTVPHKRAVLPLCDRLTPQAERIGAVNCLELAEGEVIGHNTDAGGFVDGLLEARPMELAGARAVLLGGGGAARAVAAGLQQQHADVTVVARSPAKVSWAAAQPWTTASLAAQLPACDLLIDCTSAALGPREAALPAAIPLELVPDTAVVASLVYHRVPALLAAAAARGLRTVDGAGMLVHQGAQAFSLWTGRPAPLSAMWSAFRAAAG